MKHVFYQLATLLTNNITGLDNNNLNLWNLGSWINAHEEIITWLNYVSLVLVLSLALGTVLMIYGIYGIYTEKHKPNR